MQKLISSFLLSLVSFSICANEGMWIPSLLGAVYDDMKAYGIELTPEQLYSVNSGSLKDAIVLFDGGCTGEIVSDKGLLFTNHHCGFDYIQFHSSLQNDYLKNGFWAMHANQELICEGLSVMFIVRIDDITLDMRAGIKEGMNAKEMDAILTANRKALEVKYKTENPKLGVQIKAFNYGNQYFAMVTKTYNDVRLVGAPPSEIGKFGGDTDNWVWPRHTGDFSVFRVYADANNEPASYSSQNVPYKPAHFLPIQTEGVREGEFSMVYGFPGRTEHLLTSYAVDFVMNKSNPLRIQMRDNSMVLLEEQMRASDEIRIKYAAKQSGIANGWKKWKGQQIGLTNFDAIGQKQKFEKSYQQEASKPGNEKYKELLTKLQNQYSQMSPYGQLSAAFSEYMYYGPELFNFSYLFHELISNYDTLSAQGKIKEIVQKLKTDARRFYKDFDLTTDIALYDVHTPMYQDYQHEAIEEGKLSHMKIYPSITKMESNALYMRSPFADSTALFKLLDKLNKKAIKKLKTDFFYREAAAANAQFQSAVRPLLQGYTKEIDYLMQQYTEGMMKMFPGDYWADANSTLRISFGKVEGSEPRDGEIYRHYTTSDGILAKKRTGIYDFEISDKMKDLLEQRTFGRWAENGELRVCYTGSNHTTGGNSGSPALNAKGHLVGINFDRSWESTMSDIMYNPEICRNIMVDIRYVMWVIDVWADADYLIDEMKLVQR
jgi:Peptidase S46